MDPLHLCIALTPLAFYLAFLAALNLRKRPCLLNGFWDMAALGLGLSGLMIAGPLELFLPETAAFRFGPYVWMLLIVLYLLTIALLILSMRPRLVIYNMAAEDLRPVLSTVVQALDGEARWAGEGLAMPQLGVQLHLERSPTMRNIQLVASGFEQDFVGWAKFERALRKALTKVVTGRGRQGTAMLLLACLLLAIVASSLLTDREAMAQAMQEMLRM